MNLKRLHKVADTTTQQLTKLVKDWITKTRSQSKTGFPFSQDGMTGEITKNQLECTATFYKLDNKPLAKAKVFPFTLPAKGTNDEVIPAIVDMLDSFINNKPPSTKLDELKARLGELTQAGIDKLKELGNKQLKPL